MKNILKSLLAIAFVAMLSGYANAQSLTRLCFQTNLSNVNNCQTVTTANPLPTTATLSASALSVTVTNNAAVPVIVSSPNGFGGGAGGAVTVTSGTVTEVNSAAILAAAQAAIPAGTNPIGTVTITNTAAVPAVVSCTNCGAASVTGPFNVTITNTPAVTLAATSVTITNTPADPCSQAKKVNLPISQNTTPTNQIIAASGTTAIYICSLSLISASANTVSLSTGTGSNCGTSLTALIGSVTPANSMSLAANGGLTLGGGLGTVAVTAASGEVCLGLGSAAYVAGNLTYVQQ